MIVPEIPELLFEPFPSADLRQFVEDQVANFTMVLTGTPDSQPVGFFLRHERGEFVGGCMGYIWACYLHVQWLWVAPGYRGMGQGQRLLEAAESMAVDHGAHAVALDTFNPAAKAFYLRRGYAVIGELPDYPPGFTRFYFRKPLHAPAP